MMKPYPVLRYLFIALLIFLPTCAFASSSAFGFIWSPPPTDKSIEYLGLIFGNVGLILSGKGIPLIGNLFYIFNIAVLSLGSLVVSYTIIVSTMNTAQEGDVMGRKWSSVWIPLRCAIGMGFLIPTASNYSLIQILMMQFILYGVAAADQIWSIAIANIGQPTGLAGSIQMDQSQLNQLSANILTSMVCQAVINTNPTCQSAVGNEIVSSYANNERVYVGIQNNPAYANICGSISPTVPGPSMDPTSWYNANIAAILGATNALLPVANGIYSGNTPNGDVISPTSLNFFNRIVKGTSTITPNNPTDVSKNATDNGWLYAGSYYFEFTRGGGQTTTYRPPQYSAPSFASAGSACGAILFKYIQQTATFLNANPVTGNASAGGGPTFTNPFIRGSSIGSLTNQTSNVISNLSFHGNSADMFSVLYNLIAQPIRQLTYSLLYHMTNNDTDPIRSLRNVGATIMVTCENTWLIIIIAALVVLMLACILSGVLPFCWAAGAVVAVFVPAFTALLFLLWGAGVAIGVYLPLLPYFVFTFTALGWFILVIEAIAAAPIVALGLVSPAAETLGKASAAVMIITNVFLRPSLMVLGFIIAINLVKTSVLMVNFGFFETVSASAPHLGIFGCIALVALYGGLILTIIHECFSLVHVLPDQIIRWISGQAERSQTSAQVKEAKEASESGAESGKSIMQGSASVMQEKVKGAIKEMEDLDEKKKDKPAPLSKPPVIGGHREGKGGGGGGGSGGGAPPSGDDLLPTPPGLNVPPGGGPSLSDWSSKPLPKPPSGGAPPSAPSSWKSAKPSGPRGGGDGGAAK